MTAAVPGGEQALPRKSLALCADDFGLDLPVSEAMAALAAQGRLSALSCLTNGPSWAAAAALIRTPPGHASSGLHFNLTEGAPLSPALRRRWPTLPPLPRLLALAHLRALPVAAIAEELQAQWQAFTTATGRAPAFVDGHQHVHQLPGVRAIAVAAARRERVAVRNTGRARGPGFAGKRWLIESTGGAALQRLLSRQGLTHNAVLLGVYDFQQADYRTLMQAWLAAAPARGALLFCHPGARAANTGPSRDPIAEARRREGAYLGSDAFAADLAAAGVSLAAAWPETSSAD